MKAFLKITSKLSLAVFLVAVPFLFIGFGGELLETIKNISPGNRRWTAFLLGVLLFLPVHFLAKRFFFRPWCYLETLEHELTHLLIGLLFLKIPVGFRVSAHEGGEVKQIGFGSTGQIWITLAPYFFPTVSIFVLIFAYFAEISAFTLAGVLGFSTAFHLVSNWGETSFRQPDLQKAGILNTVLILPVMNLLCYGTILAFVGNGNTGFIDFWSDGVYKTLGSVSNFFRLIF